MGTLQTKIMKDAISIFKNSGIIVYPTDTIYGIGSDATKRKVVEKIYRIKKRDRGKPMSVIMASVSMVKKYCYVNREQESILRKYLPGPYTFILKLKKKLPAAAKNKTVGIRIPDYAPIVRICKLANVPIITTSANISGKKNARRISEIDKQILTKADFVIDGGATKYKKASTVVDLTENKLLRAGAGRWRSRR